MKCVCLEDITFSVQLCNMKSKSMLMFTLQLQSFAEKQKEKKLKFDRFQRMFTHYISVVMYFF